MSEPGKDREREEEAERARAAMAEIETRLGGLLGALGDALGSALGRLGAGQGKAQGAEPGAGPSDGTFDSGPGPVRMTGHVRVRSALDAPRAGARRPARPAAARPAATPADPAPRSPVVEMREEPDGFVLVAELPGVAEADLRLEAGEGRIALSTTGARRYRVEVPAPPWVGPGMLTHRLANGILEVRARRPGTGAAPETEAGA